jgi:hypothetical protein
VPRAHPSSSCHFPRLLSNSHLPHHRTSTFLPWLQTPSTRLIVNIALELSHPPAILFPPKHFQTLRKASILAPTLSVDVRHLVYLALLVRACGGNLSVLVFVVVREEEVCLVAAGGVFDICDYLVGEAEGDKLVYGERNGKVIVVVEAVFLPAAGVLALRCRKRKRGDLRHGWLSR